MDQAATWKKNLLKITHENLIGTLNFYSRKIFKKDYHYFFQWEENAFKWKIQLMYFGLHGLIKWNQNKSSSEQRVPVTLTVGKKKVPKNFKNNLALGKYMNNSTHAYHFTKQFTIVVPHLKIDTWPILKYDAGSKVASHDTSVWWIRAGTPSTYNCMLDQTW